MSEKQQPQDNTIQAPAPAAVANFTAALEAFLAGAQRLAETQHATSETVHIETGAGPKFIRVIRALRSTQDGKVYQRGVYCFIEKATGNVLKAASWKAPAKGVRSNIYAADHGLSGVTPYGAVYHYR